MNSSMMSTHTGYGTAEVYGVPGVLVGAGDASGVGDGRGSQHRNSSMSTDTEWGNARNAAPRTGHDTDDRLRTQHEATWQTTLETRSKSHPGQSDHPDPSIVTSSYLDKQYDSCLPYVHNAISRSSYPPPTPPPVLHCRMGVQNNHRLWPQECSVEN